MNTIGAGENEHRAILQGIARRAMMDRGLLPDFSPEALAELDGIRAPAAANSQVLPDLTNRLWASIDNDDSRDLDQLTVAEGMPGDAIKILRRLLRRVRDFAQVKSEGRITPAVADKALAMLEIDENGLDEMDKRILETVIVKFGGGPVGLSSMAVAVGEEPDTLEEVYEPYLIMEGYLKRTSQGRVATELSYQKLGLKASKGDQPGLF